MLGHANTRTTLDVYGHVLQEDFVVPLEEMAGKLCPMLPKTWGANFLDI
jgi:hypothetical protein